MKFKINLLKPHALAKGVRRPKEAERSQGAGQNNMAFAGRIEGKI